MGVLPSLAKGSHSKIDTNSTNNMSMILTNQTPLKSMLKDNFEEKIPHGLNPKMRASGCVTISPEAQIMRMIAHLLQWPGIHVKPYRGKINLLYQDVFEKKSTQEVVEKWVYDDSM